MSLGTNILYYRKNSQMTQEEFADRMCVSRQTISKWESDACFPEMDKLLLMTEMFNCDLDTLVRGDSEKSAADDTCGYDAHVNGFIKKICTGIVLTMLGVCSMLVTYSASGIEYFGGLLFFAFLIPAVAFFVIAGIQNDDFKSKNKFIPYFYKQSEIDAFNKKFPVLIVSAISIILFGIMILIAIAAVYGEEAMDTNESLAAICGAIFLFLVMIGGTMAAYAGMMKSKYNIKEYNEEQNPKLSSKAQKIKSAICSTIMLTATAIFLSTGLISHAWHYNWIYFVVGGILCGIVSTIIDAVTSSDDKENTGEK